MASPSRFFAVRRISTGVVIVCSLAWAAYLLGDAWNATALQRISVSPRLSMLAFLLAAISILVGFPAFWWLVRGVSSRTPPFRETLKLHFLCQLMRHVPGRFFGVAYQIAVARHLATASQWVGVNAIHMTMALWFSAIIPISILWLTGRLEPRLGVPAILLLIGAPWLVIRIVDRLPRYEGGGRLLSFLSEFSSASVACARSSAFPNSMVWFFISWCVYACAWIALGFSIEGVGATDGLILCALYSIAWALGFLVIVTPSGLGIRELAFAALAAEYSPELVVYIALVARFGLLAADVLLGVFALVLGRERYD